METDKQRYHRWEDERDLYIEDEREKFPYKAIGMGFALFFLGAILLTLGILMLLAVISGQSDTGIALTVLGSITFLPGFWSLRIAYYAYHKTPGFSFSDLPDVE